MWGEVFMRSLRPTVPVFHRIPDWPRGEGRDGEEVACNNIVYRGTTNTVGSSGGIPLPERVIAPCGTVVLRRKPMIDRRPSVGGTDVLKATRMVVQGTEVPERHARKFGRPCRRCYPGPS